MHGCIILLKFLSRSFLQCRVLNLKQDASSGVHRSGLKMQRVQTTANSSPFQDGLCLSFSNIPPPPNLLSSIFKIYDVFFSFRPPENSSLLLRDE